MSGSLSKAETVRTTEVLDLIAPDPTARSLRRHQRPLEHVARDVSVGGLREVHPVPENVLRRVGARRRPRRAAGCRRVEVVGAAAAAAHDQRPVPETCDSDATQGRKRKSVPGFRLSY